STSSLIKPSKSIHCTRCNDSCDCSARRRPISTSLITNKAGALNLEISQKQRMQTTNDSKPVTVFVTISDGQTVIVTIAKQATIADLKKAVEQEMKGEEAGSVEKGIIMSGGRKWSDGSVLRELDGADKGVLKVSLALISVNTAKKPIVVVRKARDGNTNLSCHRCFKPTTRTCVTCGKHICASCMQLKESDPSEVDGRKRRVTFSESTAIPMECPPCAQSRAESPEARSPISPMIAMVKNHWQSNRWCIYLVIAFLLGITLLLLLKPHIPSP
ncbi:hypothetical protein BDR26DRAFT_861279, partial [Obelidium mucronatum]